MQILLLLIMAGAAFGDNFYYGDCPGWSGWTYWCSGGPWENPSSWWDDGQPYFPPGPNDVAALDNPCPLYCWIDPNVTAECLELHVGSWPADSGGGPDVATLDVNGGTLTVGCDILIGLRDMAHPSDYAIGDFNMISGTVSVGKNLYIGREGIGILNMRGGTFDVNETIWCPGGPLPPYPSQEYSNGRPLRADESLRWSTQCCGYRRLA